MDCGQSNEVLRRLPEILLTQGSFKSPLVLEENCGPFSPARNTAAIEHAETFTKYSDFPLLRISKPNFSDFQISN